MPVNVRRLLNRPIIHQDMHPSLGNNINGPSVIRVPDWVEQPLGTYYLYFAHHEGRSIRLAYADEVTGPWHIHAPGALRIEDSLFPHLQHQIRPKMGGPDEIFSLGVEDYQPHIASPDVHIDAQTQQIRMYYHGMVEDGDQKTRMAISSNGLDFDPAPTLIDHYYFRVFEYGGWFWALSWGGYLYRSPHAGGPFERGPSLFEVEPICTLGAILRHLGLQLDGDHLDLFFSRMGDTPEVILHSKVRLYSDWAHWQVAAPREVLRPVDEWEGALVPVSQSRPGASYVTEHALRDPCIFKDHGPATAGRTYLFYSGAGEQAIGVVELLGL